MRSNETIRIHSVTKNGQSIYIFDSNTPPKEVDLTSFGRMKISFGRDASNDIVLTSRLASRHHGKLICDNGQWKVVDQSSTNGIIHHDKEVPELVVTEDDFIRIDDGVEPVADGVLIIFPSKVYSKEWASCSISETKTTLDMISPLIGSFIERAGEHFYLNLECSPSEVSVNHKKAQKRMLLHEKDLISITDYRIVFTSSVIYYNQLQQTVVTEDIPQSEYHKTAEQKVPIAQKNGTPEAVSENFDYQNNNSDVIESEQQMVPPTNQDYQENHYQSENYSPDSSTGKSFRNFLASTGGYYLMSIIMAAVIWGITVALWTSQGEVALIVILACAVFGWKALNSIQPAMFIWMSWTGWIIYFCVKFILSTMIGVFVAPFKLGKLIAGAISGSI